MKKYNLSTIMKRAWELVKKAGMTISSGLKKAWKEAKGMNLTGSKKQIAWAEDIIKGAYDCIDKNIEKANNKISMLNERYETLPENVGKEYIKEDIKLWNDVITACGKTKERLDKIVNNHNEASYFIEKRESFKGKFIEVKVINMFLAKMGSHISL